MNIAFPSLCLINFRFHNQKRNEYVSRPEAKKKKNPSSMNHSYDIFFSICWVDIWNEDERTTMKHHSTPLFISQNKDVKCSKQSKNRCIWKAKMVGSHSHGNAIHHLSTVGTYNSILRSRHSYFHVSSKVCIRWTKGDSYQTIPLSFYIVCGY